MIYTHVLNKGALGVQSPADRLSFTSGIVVCVEMLYSTIVSHITRLRSFAALAAAELEAPSISAFGTGTYSGVRNFEEERSIKSLRPFEFLRSLGVLANF